MNIDSLRLKRGTDKESPAAEEDYDFEEDLHDRPKRAVNSKTAHKLDLDKNVDKLGYKLKYDYSNPRAQIGFRIFGNDLRYYTVEGMMEVMGLAKEFDPFFQASKILSGKEIKYTKSRVFLDASYNVPLSIGLPLSINAFGASSVDFRVSGNLEKMPEDWHFDIQGHFKPSVSVDVIISMQSDFFYASSGIKVKSNLYSNSELEAKIKLRGKSLVSFSFNLPQDKNEIFSARSELMVMKNNEEIPQTGIEKRRSNSTCTWPYLNDAIGLAMCSDFSVPDLSNSTEKIYPSLLLSGPLNFTMVLNKYDLSAKKYVFEYQWDEQNNNTDMSLVFHTPGSKVTRLIVANMTTAQEPFKAFNVSVAFANGPVTAKAGCHFNANPDNKRLTIFLDTNNNRSFDLNMQLTRHQDRNVWTYKPQMLLAINGVNVTGLVGTIRKNEKSGITQHDVEISFETRKLQALIKGNIIKSEITTSTNMTVNYRVSRNLKQ